MTLQDIFKHRMPAHTFMVYTRNGPRLSPRKSRAPSISEFICNFLLGRRESGNDKCWLWTRSKKNSGYGQVMCSGKNYRAHQIAFLIHYREIPTGMCVLHRCDTPSCVNPNHLFLGTQKTNVQDMVRKKRNIFGERHKNAKLSAKQVSEILDSCATNAQIAMRYGVSRTLVGKIKGGERWKHCHAEALSVGSPLDFQTA